MTRLRARVDEKLDTVTARVGRVNSMEPFADRRRLMEADGRTVVFRNHGVRGSLRVTG